MLFDVDNNDLTLNIAKESSSGFADWNLKVPKLSVYPKFANVDKKLVISKPPIFSSDIANALTEEKVELLNLTPPPLGKRVVLVLNAKTPKPPLNPVVP